MKLFVETYKSPYPTQGVFENVFIEDVAYRINRNDNLFIVHFQMYYYTEYGKRVVLDEAQLSFRGLNVNIQQGDPTSNKTAIIKILDFVFDPEIPQFLETPNPDYDANIEGSQPILYSANPDYIPESGEMPLLQYLSNHNGQFPASYEMVEWGFPTYEDALQYFEGGTLDLPELSIINPFAKEWLKNTLQMKGEAITNFDFIN